MDALCVESMRRVVTVGLELDCVQPRARPGGGRRAAATTTQRRRAVRSAAVGTRRSPRRLPARLRAKAAGQSTRAAPGLTDRPLCSGRLQRACWPLPASDPALGSEGTALGLGGGGGLAPTAVCSRPPLRKRQLNPPQTPRSRPRRRLLLLPAAGWTARS